MILGDPSTRPDLAGLGGRGTLDDLFRSAVVRRPADCALIDSTDRSSFTDGPPRQLTYADADRIVSAIARRLQLLGLGTDAMVAIQIAHTVESVLVLLGVWRAGMIAMPLPLLWRRVDTVAALRRVGAAALIVSGRVGTTDLFASAIGVAAEIFQIRFVCGFGDHPPDGVLSFDDLLVTEHEGDLPQAERRETGERGAHLAVITFDVTPDGLVPVARSHAELIAGGLAVLLEGRIEVDAVLLSTLPVASFAGLSVVLVPWLLAGGTLALHHPTDAEGLAAASASTTARTLILPGAVAPHLVPEIFAAQEGARIIGIWRAPHRLAGPVGLADAALAMIDVQVFGETGLIAARRGDDGLPAAVPFGPIAAPRGAKGALVVGEVRRTSRGTIGLRGSMVPTWPFPPGVEKTSEPQLRTTQDGFIDTGFACAEGDIIIATAPPTGIVEVGGYRFRSSDLAGALAGIDAFLLAEPDPWSGERLSGTAQDPKSVRAALARLGMNPLIADAFRDPER